MKHTDISAILSGLHYFACVGKHLSFSKAAEEVHLTPSAMSYRIKQLEEQLGFALFHRFSRHIVFTSEGRRLYATLSAPLSEIRAGIRHICNQEMEGSLVLSCTPSFAGNWLVPRLHRFSAACPGIDVHLRCRSDLVDFETENVDLAIYYGEGHHPELRVIPLMSEELTPVCAAEYARKYKLHKSADGLRDCVLLHDSSPWPNAQYFSEWSIWANWADLDRLDVQRGCSFDRSELAVCCARQGLGVAIGRMRLVGDLLKEGALVAPFLPACPSPQRYYLVCTHERAESLRSVCFSRWLEQEMAREEAQAGQ